MSLATGNAGVKVATVKLAAFLAALLIAFFSPVISVFSADISGTVLLPNGQPATWAQVALAIPGNTLDLMQAKMQSYTGAAKYVVVADSAGHFSLPTNENAWAIVAMNSAGCAQIERNDFTNGSAITLQPWGRIEGVLHIGTGLGTNNQVVLGSGPGARFFFELFAFQYMTDNDGKFVFTCVPAGTWNLSHGGESFWEGEKVVVKAGATNHVILGGNGRPVIGKILIPPTVTNPPNQATLPPSRAYVEFSDATTNQVFKFMVNAILYSTNHEGWAQMAADGSFRVEDITPGTWWLVADVLSCPTAGGMDTTMATAVRKFTMPEMAGGRSDEPLDLGAVEPVLVHSPQIGDLAPLFEVNTTDGGTFKLSSHRGQYVLLDFEPMHWRAQINEAVQAVWSACGTNRLAVLTLAVQPTGGDSGGFAAEAYPWPLANLRKIAWYEQKALRAAYGLQVDRSIEWDTNLPNVILVNPDGKIVAKGLHGEAIQAAVARFLKK